ncbi:MerR family transcriptional regulator [Criibacterium bergeronii]|uniref:MerR family transcriptional regulator n=1 Tax=Criibacterium bergeronii TaxID=1871336 RepID=A0A552V4X9_9FIRM|nr:MerR family DNA-binding transcriptional regulator [Criibacterium bergeronii]TRW25533.1 MerR family transcriptional regulator [Criibacterium bergeronii]
MKIKEVCKIFHLSADTLRYYEKEGIIPPVPRDSKGIRNYGQNELKCIERAVYLRSEGIKKDK